MKSLTSLSFATVFFLIAPAVHAGGPVHIDAKEFTLNTKLSSGWQYSPEKLSSDQNGIASISLPDFGRRLQAGTYPSGIEFNDSYARSYIVTPRPGYRVSHFELSGLMEGELYRGQVPAGLSGSPGSVWGTMDLSASAWALQPSSILNQVTYHAANVEGYVPFAIKSDPLDLSVPFEIYVSGRVTSTVWSATWQSPSGGMGSDSSTLNIAWLNPTLTIYTQPVPEPQTYAMLLGGLAVIGALRRRQRGK